MLRTAGTEQKFKSNYGERMLPSVCNILHWCCQERTCGFDGLRNGWECNCYILDEGGPCIYEPPKEECITRVSIQLLDQVRRSLEIVKKRLEYRKKVDHESKAARLKGHSQVQKPDSGKGACTCIEANKLVKCPRSMARNREEPVNPIQGPARNQFYTAIVRPPCYYDFSARGWQRY